MEGQQRTPIAVWLKAGADTLADDLLAACERLDSADGEVVVDLSAVRRIDAGAIDAMDELAAMAEEHGVRIVLRGVNVEVYKVLKLVKLAPLFAFIS